MTIEEVIIYFFTAIIIFWTQVGCIYTFRTRKIEKWDAVQRELHGPEEDGYYFFKRAREAGLFLVPLYFLAALAGKGIWNMFQQ